MRDPCCVAHLEQQKATRRKSTGGEKRLLTRICLTTVGEKQLFVCDGLQQLSMELKHLKPSAAFRPDYYMRVFPQPARS